MRRKYERIGDGERSPLHFALQHSRKDHASRYLQLLRSLLQLSLPPNLIGAGQHERNRIVSDLRESVDQDVATFLRMKAAEKKKNALIAQLRIELKKLV